MYVVDQEAVDVRSEIDPDRLTGERRFTRERLANGASESKLQAVRDYLQREFPLATIFDSYDAGLGVHTFRLENDHGALMHLAAVAVELLDGETEGGLRAFFDRHRMFQTLYRAGQRPVAVTGNGIELARRTAQ